MKIKKLDKKGFTLSVYMLVIIVVALITVMLGFGFFFQAMDTTNEIVADLDNQQKLQIDRYLTESNDRVYLPVFKQEMRKKESHTFGLGIKNILEEDLGFNVGISFLHAKDQSGNFVQVDDRVNSWFFPELGPYNLKNGERALVEIPFRVHESAKERLTYTFEIRVFCDLSSNLCNPYGYPQTISIEVV